MVGVASIGALRLHHIARHRGPQPHDALPWALSFMVADVIVLASVAALAITQVSRLCYHPVPEYAATVPTACCSRQRMWRCVAVSYMSSSNHGMAVSGGRQVVCNICCGTSLVSINSSPQAASSRCCNSSDETALCICSVSSGLKMVKHLRICSVCRQARLQRMSPRMSWRTGLDTSICGMQLESSIIPLTGVAKQIALMLGIQAQQCLHHMCCRSMQAAR